ncbi:MAG: ATP-binding protein [Vicinamibacterales bacterium]
MSWFRNLPIRRKLFIMTLASSATALVLAALGVIAWDFIQFRASIRQDVAAQASIVAENSIAPLTFADNRAAGETLAVLRLRPRVASACLYAADGHVFATYHRVPDTPCPPEPPPDAGFSAAAYELSMPLRIQADAPLLGRLYIRRDLDDLYQRARVGLGAVAGFLVMAFVAAMLIASRLQRSIASPLLQLAETARAISVGRDYSLRATPVSNDEVGVVVYAFNDMLDRIAERDAELSRANADLAHEVDERRRVEAERTSALERERDANRLKDEFLATLSHELRTPLNAVLGWTRLLRATSVDSKTQARALESIERNAHAQTRLIEDLLEISRIVTGKLRIQVRDVDLAAIVDAAIEVVQPAAVARRIQLVPDVQVRPAPSSGDPDRLQQVVWNLLSNAVKFTPEGGRVAIRLTRENGYHLTVTDSGQGIDARFLPHVFEPFRQADGTTSREHGGLGLGLAIARQLVELHGGTIQARSAGQGRGAEFEVYLPSVVAPVAAPRRTGAMPALPPMSTDPALLRNLRVLVVDDEEDARALLETTLGHYGATVVSAASAADALDAIDRLRPDVLLSDIGMPHEDGYMLIRRIRERPPGRGGGTPAIAITAYASSHDRVAALAAGFQAHVTKPFDAAELATLVNELGRGERIHGS